MKAKKIIILSGLVLSLLSLSSFKSITNVNDTIVTVEDQDGLVVYATYDGKEDYGYNFITKDRDGVEQTVTFQKVEAAVLVAFNLDTETLVGTKFKVTFSKDVKLSKDEDGMDDEDETNMITQLEKL